MIFKNLCEGCEGVPGPVISDDMVAIKMAGKEVIWQPAIFRELTATGRLG